MTAWEIRIGRYYLGPVYHIMALSYMMLANVPRGLTVVLLKSYTSCELLCFDLSAISCDRIPHV